MREVWEQPTQPQEPLRFVGPRADETAGDEAWWDQPTEPQPAVRPGRDEEPETPAVAPLPPPVSARRAVWPPAERPRTVRGSAVPADARMSVGCGFPAALAIM